MAVGVSAGELREMNEEELTTKLRQARRNCSICASSRPPDNNNHRLRIVGGDRAHLHRRERAGSGFRTRR